MKIKITWIVKQKNWNIMKKITNTILILLLASVTVSAENYVVNTSSSVLKWNGKKVAGEHYGKISLKEGSFTLKNNKLTDGKFVIDMKSITSEDLPAGEWNDKLVGHLKSDDFFGVETYPESVLTITESTPIKDGKTKVKGKLTIKGITHPIEFDAFQNGMNVTAKVTVDRSKYNVRYGSGKFFQNLGDKTIYDDFTIDVSINAAKK